MKLSFSRPAVLFLFVGLWTFALSVLAEPAQLDLSALRGIYRDEALHFSNSFDRLSHCKIVWDQSEYLLNSSKRGMWFTVQCMDDSYGDVYAPIFCTAEKNFSFQEEKKAHCWIGGAGRFFLSGVYWPSDTPERRELALDLVEQHFPHEACHFQRVLYSHYEIRISKFPPFPTPSQLEKLGDVDYEYQCEGEPKSIHIRCFYLFKESQEESLDVETGGDRIRANSQNPRETEEDQLFAFTEDFNFCQLH